MPNTRNPTVHIRIDETLYNTVAAEGARLGYDKRRSVEVALAFALKRRGYRVTWQAGQGALVEKVEKKPKG